MMGSTRVLYVSLFFAIFSLNPSILVQETVKETNRKSRDETRYMDWPLAKETSLERRENLPSRKQNNYIVTNEPNLSWRKQFVWYYTQPSEETDIYNNDKIGLPSAGLHS